MKFTEKLKSRKFLLTVLTVVYSAFQSDPKYAALATIAYVAAEGLVDLAYAKKDVGD